MVSACSRAGRGSTRRAYQPKVPKSDQKSAYRAKVPKSDQKAEEVPSHQDWQHEAPSKERKNSATWQERKNRTTVKPDQSKPAVKPPPGLECMLHATHIEEEVPDQVLHEEVCKTSAVEPPPGLERATENLPATPETADPEEVQEAISESDDVTTITGNPPYPFHVKDVSECAACSGNVLAPTACCVSIEGLPNAILNEPMVLAMLQQAGLIGDVITFSMCEGDPCGEAHVSFSSVHAALRCVYHFEGCQWDASGSEVTAKMTPLESMESVESLDYALGMDAAIDYACCPAIEGEALGLDATIDYACCSAMEGGEEHLGAMTEEQACEILQEHLGAMAQEETCEILQENAGAMLSAEAVEFIPFDAESQQPPGILRADAPAFEAMPNDSMVYEMMEAEACNFMAVHGPDCMVAFAGEAHHTLLSADSPPFVPGPPILVAARAESGPSAKEEGHPAAAVPTKLGVSSDTSTELGESDVDDDKGGLVV